MCETECLNDVIQHLRRTFRQKRYNTAAFNRAMHKKHKRTTQKERLTAVASLPLQQSTSYENNRLLGKFNIKTVHIRAKKSFDMLIPVKDDYALEVSGVNSIPCKYGKVYKGQTRQCIETRCKQQDQPSMLDKSTVPEHNNESGHRPSSKRLRY
jgi:hypothetical protein